MKKLSQSLLLSLVLNLIPSHISAQHNSGCFMVDSNGNPLDLGHLCRSSEVKSISNPRGVSPNNTESDVFVVPIKRIQGRTPVIEVRFNDRYVFEMLVDTGATWTVITSSMAKALKIKSKGKGLFSTVAGDIELEVAKIDSVIVGELIKEDLDIAIAPSMNIGLLGQNFSDTYIMSIDINEGVIKFDPY